MPRSCKRIGKGTSATASYVALTRVQRREDLLIYRPFERDLFTKGERRGPMLLLSSLRGEAIDWDAIEAEFMPHALSKGCGFVKFKPAFAQQQWTRESRQQYCRDCVGRRVEEGTPLQCNTCLRWKAESAFSGKHQHFNCINTRVCEDCVEKRICKRCGEPKEEDDFPTEEWMKARRKCKRGHCKSCVKRQNGCWTCIQCKERKERREFHKSTNGVSHNNYRKRCDVCMDIQEAARSQIRLDNKRNTTRCADEGIGG